MGVAFGCFGLGGCVPRGGGDLGRQGMRIAFVYVHDIDAF